MKPHNRIALANVKYFMVFVLLCREVNEKFDANTENILRWVEMGVFDLSNWIDMLGVYQLLQLTRTDVREKQNFTNGIRIRIFVLRILWQYQDKYINGKFAITSTIMVDASHLDRFEIENIRTLRHYYKIQLSYDVSCIRTVSNRRSTQQHQRKCDHLYDTYTMTQS